MPKGVNNNLIPANERSKEELSAMGKKGQPRAARARVEKRNFREAVIATLKTRLPSGVVDDTTQAIVDAMIKTGKVPSVQDGVVAALFSMVFTGGKGAVEASKLLLAQAGEDTPEQHEILIKAGSEEVRDFMG